MSTIVGYTSDAVDDLLTVAKARSSHTGVQPASSISDLTEVLQDLLASSLVAGANITKTYDDGAGTITIASSGGGGGIVEGIALSAHTLGTGSAAANTTALNAAVAAAKAADKPLINDLGAITIDINDRIDMLGDNFRARFNGLTLRQTVANKAGVRFGGPTQDIDGLTVWNIDNPDAADTNANGFEFTNCLFSRFTNLVAINWARGFYMPQEAPTIMSSTSNTVFSCYFENLRFNGWAISAIDFRTWLPGSASSTGNVWNNVYCHNNYFGSADACTSSAIVMRAHDESIFNQVNVEWCLPAGDAVFFQECRNMVFNSLHYEGITLTNNSALFRAYFDCRITIHGISAMTTTIANNTGQKSIFRGYSIGGNPLSLDVTSIRVRNTTNAGSRPFSLMEIESGSTDGNCEFRKSDTSQFNGSIVVDPTTVIPRQVSRVNDISYRNFTAPNIPIDLVRTANATDIVSSTTLVTDDVMQYALEASTRYMIEGCIFYLVAAASDMKFRFNYTGTGTARVAANSASVLSTTSGTNAISYATVSLNQDNVAGGVDSVGMSMPYRGIITTTTAGTLSFQYAQNTSGASALNLREHSHMSIRKLS